MKERVVEAVRADHSRWYEEAAVLADINHRVIVTHTGLLAIASLAVLTVLDISNFIGFVAIGCWMRNDDINAVQQPQCSVNISISNNNSKRTRRRSCNRISSHACEECSTC